MELLTNSRLGDFNFNLVPGKIEDESGEVFSIKYVIDPKYHFTLMRDKGPSGDVFRAMIMPSEMLYTPITKGSSPFEECFELIRTWVSDLEAEFYDMEDYKQTMTFRDQFLQAFRNKYGNGDEMFMPNEIAQIEERLKLFESAMAPLYSKEVKLTEGEKPLSQLVEEVAIDANIYTHQRWVQVGGSKIFHIIKLVYKNITHSSAELESAQKQIQILLT